MSRKSGTKVAQNAFFKIFFEKFLVKTSKKKWHKTGFGTKLTRRKNPKSIDKMGTF